VGSKQERRGVSVVDRKSRKVFTEKVLGGSWMDLAYRRPLHPLLKFTLFRSGLASRLLGWYTRLPISRSRILPTIESLEIDVSEFAEPVESFRTFHDFFVRRLKPGCRPFDPDPEILCSPADSRMTLIPELDSETRIPAKGSLFSIEKLTHRENLQNFEGGCAFVFRLCPADYHRYHFPAGGRLIEDWEISGRYDSVHPTALKLGIPVFSENRRVVSLLELENFGPCLFVEVGAFGVGGIIQTHQDEDFLKGDEKGYFQYGASTIILVLEKKRLHIDRDLSEISATGMECLIHAGENLGRLRSS